MNNRLSKLPGILSKDFIKSSFILQVRLALLFSFHASHAAVVAAKVRLARRSWQQRFSVERPHLNIKWRPQRHGASGSNATTTAFGGGPPPSCNAEAKSSRIVTALPLEINITSFCV